MSTCPDLQLVEHDVTAQAPERDHFAEAPQLDLQAPEASDMTVKEVS